jgi:hypothetical protein
LDAHIVVERSDTEYDMGCVTSDGTCAFARVDAAGVETFLREVAEEEVIIP